MKLVSYDTPQDLQLAAITLKQKVYFTDTSQSFRIYDEQGKTIEFHFYKKQKP